MEKKKQSNKGLLAFFYDDNVMKIIRLENFETHYPNCAYTVDETLKPQYSTIYWGCGDDKVELDPTTMKRIAKYNADRDVSILIKKKEVLEEEIKQLEEKQQNYIKKFDSAREFVNDFISSSNTNVDDYIKEYFIDDDCDDWD